MTRMVVVKADALGLTVDVNDGIVAVLRRCSARPSEGLVVDLTGIEPVTS